MRRCRLSRTLEGHDLLLVGEPESQGELPYVAMPDLIPNLLCSLGLFLCHVDATRLATVL